MAADRDPELADLEKRLKAFQGADESPVEAETRKQSSMAYRMGSELVAGVLVGGVLGYGLDVLLGTMPLLLIVLMLLGFAAGVRNSVRSAQKMQGDMMRAQEQSVKEQAAQEQTKSGQSGISVADDIEK